MSPSNRDAKKHAKARQRHRRTAQERRTRDRRQAQHAAEAHQQALDDLGLPQDGDPVAYGQKNGAKAVGRLPPKEPTFLTRPRLSLCPQRRMFAGTQLFPGEPKRDRW